MLANELLLVCCDPIESALGPRGACMRTHVRSNYSAQRYWLQGIGFACRPEARICGKEADVSAWRRVRGLGKLEGGVSLAFWPLLQIRIVTVDCVAGGLKDPGRCQNNNCAAQWISEPSVALREAAY